MKDSSRKNMIYCTQQRPVGLWNGTVCALGWKGCPLKAGCLGMALALLFSVSPALATEDDEEISLDDIAFQPYVYLVKPEQGISYDGPAKLTVQAGGQYVEAFDLELTTEDGTQTARVVGTEAEHTFVFDRPQVSGGTLTVRGYADAEPTDSTAVTELVRRIPSPKEELIEKMIALAYANSKDNRYKFAPAETDSDIGVCKNFVMRLFDTYSKGYRMREYPELSLHMPVNNSKKACAPYDYGIEWKPETPDGGSPFEIAAQFKYDNDLSEEENAKLARQLVEQIQKGDFFQIVGYYGGGNGPHSMYVIQGYDPDTDMIHWTDSNMRGTRVNGARWGYMQYDADAEADWWVKVFNMKKRGATVYRLRDDLYKVGGGD